VVAGIVDGDTIGVRVEQPGGPLRRGSHTLRLLEIDTPETFHPTVGVECYGPEASAFAARELPVGSQVWLLADQEDQDQYDRYLRYVWTGDGTFFNLQAVAKGYAEAVLYEPNDLYINQMYAAERKARAANRGLWGACRGGGQPRTTPAPAPAPARPRSGGNCDPNYSGACIPVYPPDVDCDDVPATNFRVVGSDPHGLDAEGDRVACEG
jgi:micrococcal nuclease